MLVVGVSILLLVCLFIFIFLGVQAFFGGGTLSTIVNSGMCAGTGVAMAATGKKDEAPNDKKIEDNAAEDPSA